MTTWISQLALRDCTGAFWLLFSRETFLLVTIFALYYGSSLLELVCSISNLVQGQTSIGKLNLHFSSESVLS